MELMNFGINLSMALGLGVLIGIERQWGAHPAGLRTNTLVCVGAALFVSLTKLMGDTQSPTRIAAYIVSGIGFLGGGVILKEGPNVKGMNTAATIWCSGAIGTLTGAGFPFHAFLGTLTVLAIHIGLRPLAGWLDARREISDVETNYKIRVLCTDGQESLIRTILLRHVNSHARMNVHGLSTTDSDQPGKAMVVADIIAAGREDRAVQEILSRLHIEPGVASVSWEKVTSL